MMTCWNNSRHAKLIMACLSFMPDRHVDGPEVTVRVERSPVLVPYFHVQYLIPIRQDEIRSFVPDGVQIVLDGGRPSLRVTQSYTRVTIGNVRLLKDTPFFHDESRPV